MQSIKARVATLLGAGALALAASYTPSPAGLQVIRDHEGLRTQAYVDPVGIPTICYGSTRKVFIGQRATLRQCEDRLLEDATYAGTGVARGVKVKLTQSQYDALVDFVFNIGETKFYSSTLLRKINAGDCLGAAREFDRWVYAGGKVLPGLVKRRYAERKQWEEGCTLW